MQMGLTSVAVCGVVSVAATRSAGIVVWRVPALQRDHCYTQMSCDPTCIYDTLGLLDAFVALRDYGICLSLQLTVQLT